MKTFWRVGGLLMIVLVFAAAFRAGDWWGAYYAQEERRRPPQRTDADQVRELYDDWKWAHGGSVDELMQHYAPAARIVREGGNVENVGQLKALAGLVRGQKTFNDVRDLTEPIVETDGDKITLRAQHRYGHSNPQFKPLSGQRKLVWRKLDGRWLIVEDVFPKTYVVVQ